ncbi:ankyrin [Wolfiporia cocos MD-104 SS10]|uniref:Ankyrin n=1 Tax=Wolfiporia cocos (strain MD-104) TaxID=742152 RepID=A0A2H3JFW1_WOLCO|nr:ankyrin [Wolfiporia cocos MD-104 SS10]
MSVSTPTAEDLDELFISCRYGDLEDIQQFVDRFGADHLNEIRDDNGNTVLHMVCANGHTEVLEYLLPKVSPSLLSAQNEAKSTPLHWAAVNSHLSIAQALVRYRSGPGITLIDIKNSAGRSPLGEAENVGWEEGAKWFVEVMNLDDGGKEEELRPANGTENIEVEIQDAEGQVAKMSIGSRSKDQTVGGDASTT